MKRKILLSATFYCLICLHSVAQMAVQVTITDLDNETLTAKMESNLSGLLSEINSACYDNRLPVLEGKNLSKETVNSISLMWENMKFRCDESEIVETCLHTYNQELEVRNIPLIFPDAQEDDQYHEVAVTFDTSGMITSFHVTISQNLYRKAMASNNNNVTDLRRRQMILDYVEQFRTAYNCKDIDFLNQIFSDDALIITGRVIKVKPSKENDYMKSKVVYNKQDKQTYLKRLGRIFKRNKVIRVKFDEIKVQMHPTKSDWYGVTLHQGYSSDSYHDDGWLFLLWDFSNESEPVIHVRTWQPDINTVTGEAIKEDEIFGLKDTDIK